MSKYLSGMQQVFFFLFVNVLLLSVNSAHASTNKMLFKKSFADRKDVQAFILEMEKKHQFDPQQLKALFKSIASEPKVLKAISKPYERLPWYRYQNSVVSDKRIQGGVKFWKENEAALKKAEVQFGVPAEIIVAIIGVESKYGTIKGKFPVLQTLATLAFDYPRRAKFFRKELEAFLLLTKEQGFDPLKMLGSYAGAMGNPQFMPSNYRQYATNLSGQGPSDIINNMNDAIASVANYFKAHGWKNGESIAHSAKISGTQHLSLNKKDRKNPKPAISLKNLAKYGVHPAEKIKLPNKEALTAFITLESANDNEYWLGFNNFYVITRYNPSTHYGMAVFQLSEHIRALHES